MGTSLDQNAICRCCGKQAPIVGRKLGRYVKRQFTIARCAACGFGFVVDPLENPSVIYDEAYYHGCGADPLVDYVDELEHPEASIRNYEWRGIMRVVETLRPQLDGLRWLDYGCGNGGLVRHIRNHSRADIVGFEVGWIVERARAAGIPIIDQSSLTKLAGTFDVVTAVEVIEHVADPHEVFRIVRSLLKPGGCFFYTTGNAAPVRELPRWSYVTPEIHVSFFEPRTLSILLRQHGFRDETHGFLTGYEDIIRFKVLKNLGRRRISPFEALVPWRRLSPLVDRRFQVTAHPYGIATG